MPPPNPHDELFKASFGQPDVARSELELVLPAAVREQLDLRRWSSARPSCPIPRSRTQRRTCCTPCAPVRRRGAGLRALRTPVVFRLDDAASSAALHGPHLGAVARRSPAGEAASCHRAARAAPRRRSLESGPRAGGDARCQPRDARSDAALRPALPLHPRRSGVALARRSGIPRPERAAAASCNSRSGRRGPFRAWQARHRSCAP